MEQGSTVYSLGVSNAASGLTDVATGEAIVLSMSGSDVVGRTAIGNVEAFRISVNGTGDVTLDQIRAITHPTGGIASPDELVRIAAGTVSLTATVTDKDNDTASTSIDLGVKVGFRDDAPSVSTNTVSTVLEVDETVLTSNDSENFASAFTVNYGADGAGSTVYSLGVSSAGEDSLLDDVASGNSIYLYENAGVIYGQVNNTTGIYDASGINAFTLTVNSATGDVTLDQIRAITHPTGGIASPDELVRIAAGTVSLTATVTDKDNDTASTSIDLGVKVGFRDDAPSVSTNTVSTVLEVDETVLTSNDSENFASAFTVNYGADGAGSTVYSLGVSNAASGLTDVATGEAIVLSMSGSDVVGRTAIGNVEAFRISVNGTGDVTLDQIRAITHPTGGIASPDELVRIAAGTVSLTATVTDKDNDTASTSIDLWVKLASVMMRQASALILSTVLEVDETVLTSNDSENFASAFTVNYGADGAGSTVYSLGVSSAGEDSLR